MDAARLKDNYARVAGNGVVVAEFFYADLFQRNPRLRSLFPASMTRQHEVLLGALTRIVSHVDDTVELVPYLRDLGRRHYAFGVMEDHYDDVGASLVATLRYFSGSAWNPALEDDWTGAYALVAQVMREAAGEAEHGDVRVTPGDR